ncbi:MAG: hypothetical protein IJ087_10650 [Eggerthellaceae bacterium]|nr:hypothetical protein [Eggerthellaceae bacterium]
MHAKALSVFVSIVLALGLCPGFAFADSLQAVELPAVEGVADTTSEEPAAEVVAPVKRFNSMLVRVAHKVVKAKSLKSANRTLTKAVTVVNAQGAVQFSKPSKRLCKQASVNKQTGDITVKKGTKADTYAVLVKVTASGDDTHLPMTKAALVRITVK